MSCSTGCCTAAGDCVTQTTTAQCGNAGATCRACSSGQTCTNGACVATGTGGGSGATAGGSGATAGGSGATAGGSGATAGGSGATAGGSGATAGGSGATAGGSGATAGGSGATAGGSAGTAGGLATPDGGVTLTFMANCPAFTACGGNVDPNMPTTWTLSGGCIDDALFTQVTSLIDAACGSSGTVVFNKTGYIQGTVTFGGMTATRNASGAVRFSTTTPMCSGFCPLVSSGASQYMGTCSANGSSCDCTGITLPLGANESGNYVVSSSSLSIMTSLSDGGTRNRSFDYCITSSPAPTLTYRETTPASAGFVPDPGIITLTR